MQVDSSYITNQYTSVSTKMDSAAVAQKAVEDKLDAKSITNAYLAEYQLQVQNKTNNEFSAQSTTFSLLDIGYTGKPIAELTKPKQKS